MRWPYALLTIAYCTGIWWLSSQPEPPKPPYEFPGMDKVAHAVVFGGLAALVGRGLRRSGRRYGARMLFWGPVLFAAAYGVVDEVHQYFVPLRVPSLGDLIADVAGAALVQVLLRRYRLRGGLHEPTRAGTD